MPPILLLHLSDLHFGPHSRFLGEKPDRLGKSFHRALAEAQKKLGIDRKVDLVFVTGDFAESGLPAEFDAGCEFLTSLAGEIGLPPQKFVFVPGNHDVNWDACQEAFYHARKEGRTTEPDIRAALDLAKFEFYDAFVQQFYGKDDPREPLTPGAFLYRFEDLRLAVAALNSCEKESHRKGDHVGHVGRDQAESAMAALRRSELAGWLKVIAVHHNPDRAKRNNLDGWRTFLAEKGTFDEDLLARYESDALGLEGRDQLVAIAEDSRVQLLLHGHQHASDKLSWDWRVSKGHTHVFSSGSLSLKADVLPGDEPASVRLIVLDPEKEEIRADRLVYLAWNRVEAEVERGSFALDSGGTIVQHLDLPRGFSAEQIAPVATARTPIDSEFLRAFRQRFADQYAPWDLGSLGAVRPGGVHEAKEARLDDMYLELRFDPEFNPEITDAGKPLRVEDLLSRDKPLALTGAAGAGKTTWARYTFRQLVSDERVFPLMLVLRDVAHSWQQPGSKGEDRSIDAALEDWIGAQMGTGWKDRLTEALKSGPRPILLVDGWDELGPLGEEFRDKLMGFLRAHPRVLAVVTSRPYGEQKPSHADGFEKLEVQPLSNTEIEEMTRKFFGRFSGKETATRADQFLSAMERAPEARSLARTPLLLTMMLLVGYSQPLPDKRHQLYARCIDTLLHDRPEQKAGEGALTGRHTWCPPGLDKRRRWAAALAYRVQSEGYEAINDEEVYAWRERAPIVRSWKELESFLPQEPDSRDGFLAWLVEVAGLLIERTDGTLAFTHLSFQEYLTALHLATTSADHAQRLAAFQDRISETHWWETLRLLAAQIDSANPEFLEIALSALLDDSNVLEGISFVGTVIADGLGSEGLEQAWSYKYLSLLGTSWPNGADFCASAWRSSQQDVRKYSLARCLIVLAASQSWLGWLRCEMFGSGWAPVSDLAERATTRGIVQSLRLSDHHLSRDAVAAGRILAGSYPIWPADHKFGSLHLWPGYRRLAGLQFQSAAAAGASREALITLGQGIFFRPAEGEEVYVLARDVDRALVGRLNGFWETGYPSDLTTGLDRCKPSDLARDLARFSSPYLDDDMARRMADNWANKWLIEMVVGPNDWQLDWVRDLVRAPVDIAEDSNFAWLGEFKRIERASCGRTAARAFLAQLDSTWDGFKHFLSSACRSSLAPNHPPEPDLLQPPPDLDPLWPALARHIARMSTSEDKALLETLARTGGEGYPEPLCWGLQFIVRGDVLLDDGSVVTLDELADEAGVPRLPYLEEMEPELEVDWDADEEVTPDPLR